MPEYVGNYSIRTANVNVEGADTLEGAVFMYNRPPLLIILLIIHGFGVEFPQLYIKDSYPKLSICRPNLRWLMLLVSCSIAS